MSGNEIREKYLKFMEQKGHAIIPSAPLVPLNDPTTLFTGSGMQPLVPYLMGEPHPKGTRLTNSQKCFRAEDIDEVGDNRHTTFFEMLGNWSLGDYFKKEQLPWFFEFLTKEIGLDPKQLYITVFLGDEVNNVPRDNDSVAIWKDILKQAGVSHEVADIGSGEAGYARGMKEGERIFYYDASKNWWSRSGTPENMPEGEIGGPDSEVFYDFDPTGKIHDPKYGKHCHPNCDCGRFLEIGNSVFMEYIKAEGGTFKKLPKQNVDFGGGLERIVAASKDNPDIFTIDLLYGVIQQLEIWTGKKYENEQCRNSFRIIADHLRAAVFMIADGVRPSNSEQGYFVRRLIRRAVLHADRLGLKTSDLYKVLLEISNVYKNSYPVINRTRADIAEVIGIEEEQFRKTLEKGMREFEKVASGTISGHDAFILFSTFGFPYELTEELAAERGIMIDRKEFDEEMKKHQEESRAGAEQKFKGGLADHSEKVLQYHTTTHLLLAGLRKELGEHVHQAGSNITAERLRFDFTHPERVEREVLDQIEIFVNEAIKAGAGVTIETVPKTEAENDPSVEGSFWDKYPDEVKVYTIKNKDGKIYSRELCGGPHVENTSAIHGTFKITKEESSSAGVRRIKAVLV